MCDTNSTKRALMLALWFSFWAIQIIQTDAKLRILPEVEKDEQFNEEGSTLTLTCIDDYFNINLSDNSTDQRWKLPQSEWERGHRLNTTTFKNETHRIVTMTLVNLNVEDTGYYRCQGLIPLYDQKRFVYVSSTEKLISMTNEKRLANHMLENEVEYGHSRTISFTTTHPNVSISIFKDGTERNTYLEVWNSSNKNSRWSFNPRNGLTLKNPTVFDSAYYYVFAHLPFVNGKPVKITHSDPKTEEMIRRIFPSDRIDAIDGINLHLAIPGIEVEREGAPDDPVEGSNITLICTYYLVSSNYYSRVPPTWLYYANGDATWHTFSNDFLKEPNADIRNEIENNWEGINRNKLHLINVTLNTPYTKFKCVYGADNSIIKEISFTIKEIDNEPLSNSISLENGVGQNLICNRWSQHVPIHWLKEAQSAKQPFNRLKSRNPAAILKAEMAIRSIPSKGKACLDRFSMAANGTVRPTISNSITGQRQCSFFINAPANKLIEMTCSVVNLKSSGAGLAIYGAAEINVNPPVVNRIYTSRSDSMFLFFKVDNTDWFDCKWKMISVPQTTEYQLCRNGTSTTPNGKIQRSAADTSTDPRMCMFAIEVPFDHRIQLMCSNVTLISPDNYLQVQTISETVIADPPAMNRVYTSTSEIIYLFSHFSNRDSFECQWTTVMIPPLPTDNKLCREKITKSASGNIQPLMANGPNVQPNSCSFIIEVPPNQLTEISCPVINFTSPGSYLHFSGISDLSMALTPLANREYTSGVDLIYLNSQIDVNKDWFNCTWKAIPVPSTTDFKLCRHGGTKSSSGTLQPFLDDLTTGEPRECYFFIELPLDEQIEFSCSSINLSSPGSYLRVVGVSDFDENPPVENGIYLSNGRNVLVYSQFNNGDWFDCIWASTTCPVPVTTDDATSTASTTAMTTPATTSSTIGRTTTSAQPTTSTTTTMATTTPLPIPFNFSVSDPGVCGSMLTSLTSTGGVVQSPNFPGDYGNEARDCLVTITAPEGSMIQLTFTTFNLEVDKAYVQIDDGRMATGLFPTKVPTPVASSTGTMAIYFAVDNSNKTSSAVYNWQATFSVTRSTVSTTAPTTTTMATTTLKTTTDGTSTSVIASTSSTKSSSTLSSTSTTRTTSTPVPTTTTTKPSTSTSLQNASTTTSPEQTTPATTSQTETTTASPPTTFSANPTTQTITVTETTRPTSTTTSIKEQTTSTTTPAATTETTPQSTTPPTTWADKTTTSTAPTTSTSQADTTTSTVSSTSSYPSSFVSSTTPTTPATTTTSSKAAETTTVSLSTTTKGPTTASTEEANLTSSTSLAMTAETTKQSTFSPTTETTSGGQATTSTTTSATQVETTTTKTTPTPFPILYNCSVSSPACGNMCTNLTSGGGVVQSPNFPGDYGNENEYCVVTITAPAGWMIQLKFTTFNLEFNKAIVYVDDDYVNLLYTTTGNTIPALVPATINKMNIRFQCSTSSKPSTAIYNWQATFSVTSQGSSCSGNDPACGNMCNNVTSAGTGVVQSPNFPGDYGKESNQGVRMRFVTIVVSAGKKIQLTFTTFNLETGKAYIYVGDRNTYYLGSVTGNTIPAVVTTASNIMYIRFDTYPSTKPTTATYNWQATYTAV